MGFAAVLGCLCGAFTPAAHADDERVSYARDVRPLLSDRCFRCHGPDRITRQADLRFDVEESVFRDRGGYQVVVPGDPEASELVRRITATDEAERMPPVDSGATLSESEIALIRRWVAQGARWEPHWAYLPPKRPEPPEVTRDGWVRNPIDQFVLARLEAAGLAPSPEADRRTLIRRVSLDLTGLPPTPDEVAAFLADDRPQAYEAVVDRLLQSSHYGERMALPWLEAARYADTSGYQEDYGRFMYPWRTWVIDAFNSNMPFDQFVIEQMAGDLLPNATRDQILATAFNRNHRINQEVGAIPEEFLVEYAVDRLETMATVFLGTTIGCARCHDHKYDPFTQRDFYQLYAFLNNNDDEGVDQVSRFGFCKPFIEYPTEEQQAELERMTAELEALKAQETPSEEEQRAFADWLADWSAKAPLGTSDWYALGPFEHAEASRVGGFDKPFISEPIVDLAAHHGDLQWKTHPEWVDGQAAFLNGQYTTFYVFRELYAPEEETLKFEFGASDAFKMWVNGTLVSSRLELGENNPKAEPIEILLQRGRNELLLKLSNSDFSQAFVFRSVERKTVPPEIFTILDRPDSDRSAEDKKRLYDHFHSLRIREHEAKIAMFRGRFPKVMVMQEREEVRPAHLLNRGNYADPLEEVERNTPAVLPPLPAGAPRNRLGLAQWLVSPENPLTARVTVNRFWQMYFGVGLVKTAEDFGAQGEWPSHPDLLDWLATEFIRSGWDVKHMQRLIVTSATYRQSSRSTRELVERDPENRLLARGPRFRLRPHVIRDQALFVSGLLVEHIGGPSVKPYQPEGLWEEVSNLLLLKQWFLTNRYVQDHGDKLYRRSLYTFWKRALPPPGMTIFDAESREVCSVRTQISNTPLQALHLLNDVTYLEAARHLAARMLNEGGDTDAARLSYGMELATCRPPNPVELQVLSRGLVKHLAIYRDDPDQARALLGHGESPNPGHLDPVLHAAYTQIALLLLNLDETITKQ